MKEASMIDALACCDGDDCCGDDCC